MTGATHKARVAPLDDRGSVSVYGPDATKFLQGLVTNDVEQVSTAPEALAFAAGAVYAGLLSPQGKILFDIFCVRTLEGFVLDVARDQALHLAKRLAMYKLRAAVDIQDVSDRFSCLALWGANACSSGPTAGTIAFRDPRHPDLGFRILAEARFATDIASATNGAKSVDRDYHAHRIALGVAEGGKDFEFSDAYPHEANFDLFHGTSFQKGCYVGQEVVARMQNKTVVRKRVVKVIASGSLTYGNDILVGETPVGRVGTTDDRTALAMLRLDRAAEAEDKGISLIANGAVITPDPDALARYRQSAASRPSAPALI